MPAQQVFDNKDGATYTVCLFSSMKFDWSTCDVLGLQRCTRRWTLCRWKSRYQWSIAPSRFPPYWPPRSFQPWEDSRACKYHPGVFSTFHPVDVQFRVSHKFISMLLLSTITYRSIRSSMPKVLALMGTLKSPTTFPSIPKPISSQRSVIKLERLFGSLPSVVRVEVRILLVIREDSLSRSGQRKGILIG